MPCLKLLVLDIDGTLINTNARFERCLKESKNSKEFWNCYESEKYIDLDEPNWAVINFVKSLINEDAYIAIISGRNERLRQATIKQLTSIGIPINELHLRKDGDFRKGFEVKQERINELIDKLKPCEVIIFDDDVFVIKNVKCNVPCKKFLVKGDYVP